MTYVTRNGSQLLIGASPFNFLGANIFWLGLINDPSNTLRYPTSYEVDDALQTAVSMGCTVVRSYTCGISVGNAYSVEPSLSSFNETALRHIDYVVKRCGDLGLRLIIPLTDYNSTNYAGSMLTFCQWRSSNNILDFYTNSTIIADFEAYINTIVTRTNWYTGVAYNADPTIMAWETGNALLQASTTWTTTIANYIKGIDSNHLVIDGSYGVASTNLAISSVDIYSNHFYPVNAAQVASDAALAANVTTSLWDQLVWDVNLWDYVTNKAYMATEFDWRTGTSAQLANFLNAIGALSLTASGACFWNIQPHSANGNYTLHSDSYPLYYPGQSTADENAIAMLQAHSIGQQGIVTYATTSPTITAPLLLSAVIASGVCSLSWQGSTGAYSYTVEMSTQSTSGPFSQIAANITDFMVPFTGNCGFATLAWFRVRGYAADKTPGQYSNVLQSGTKIFVDTLRNFDVLYAVSANLVIDTTNPSWFNGDNFRMKRTAATAESIVYHVTQINNASLLQVVAYFDPSEPISDMLFATSPDNVTYSAATATTVNNGGSYTQIVYTVALPAGTNYVQVTWSNLTGHIYSPQLAQVTIYGTP